MEQSKKQNFEIVEKKNKNGFTCGPVGDMYEIKFHMIDDDSYIYLYSEDAFMGSYILAKCSLFEILENNDMDISVPDEDLVEMINEYSDITIEKSKYKGLYLEMDKYIEEVHN